MMRLMSLMRLMGLRIMMSMLSMLRMMLMQMVATMMTMIDDGGMLFFALDGMPPTKALSLLRGDRGTPSPVNACSAMRRG